MTLMLAYSGKIWGLTSQDSYLFETGEYVDLDDSPRMFAAQHVFLPGERIQASAIIDGDPFPNSVFVLNENMLWELEHEYMHRYIIPEYGDRILTWSIL